MDGNRAHLQPIHHTRLCACQRARCGTGRNPAAGSTVVQGRNQFESIVIRILRHTSSGWDCCLSAMAERRRTWKGPKARLKRHGLTRIPWRSVRATGRVRVTQIIERDSINSAAFSQERVAPAGRGRVEKNICNPEYMGHQRQQVFSH
jgi:hypothetical protein